MERKVYHKNEGKPSLRFNIFVQRLKIEVFVTLYGFAMKILVESVTFLLYYPFKIVEYPWKGHEN